MSTQPVNNDSWILELAHTITQTHREDSETGPGSVDMEGMTEPPLPRAPHGTPLESCWVHAVLDQGAWYP